MIDSNIEKLANTTLVKLVILCVALEGEKSKHKELLLRKLRNFYSDNISDNRIATQLVLSISQIDSYGDTFKRYLGQTIINVGTYSMSDINRLLKAFSYTKTKFFDSDTLRNHLEKLMERVKVIWKESSDLD